MCACSWQYYVYIIGMIIAPFIYVSWRGAQTRLDSASGDRLPSLTVVSPRVCASCRPLLQMFACVSSYYLYKELRNVVNEASGAMGDDGGMGGGGYAQAQPVPEARQAGGGAGWSHAESHPSGAPSGFKAFSGQGNRLGGS